MLTIQQFIFDNLITSIGRITSTRCNRKWMKNNGFLDEWEQIQDLTDFLKEYKTDKISLRIRCIINNQLFVPTCNRIECSETVTFNNGGLSKYCSRHGCSDDSITQKKQKTCIEKYGVDNPSKSSLIKEKIKEGLSKVDWEAVNKKREVTTLLRRGVTHHRKDPNVVLKTQITNQKRYGGPAPACSQDVIKKMQATQIAKHGSLSTCKHISLDVQAIMKSEKRFTAIVKKFKSSTIIASELGISESSVLNLLNKYNLTDYIVRNVSLFEHEVGEFIQDQNVEIIRNSRALISPKEIDIVLPNINVGIECDGLFYHCEYFPISKTMNNRNNHVDKTNMMESNDYSLLHIWDTEWNNPITQKIWKSLIKSKLGIIKRKIFARKCSIKEIPNRVYRDFVTHNHLQGYAAAKYRYGLFYNDSLVGIMSLNKCRYGNNDKWEIVRSCNLLNTIVVGGMSKLLHHFRKQYAGTILSYANRRWSQGNAYEALGFEYIRTTSPNYFYTDDYLSVKSRQQFQKKGMMKKLDNYVSTLTEWENMRNHGYNRIWDCGNLVYELR